MARKKKNQALIIHAHKYMTIQYKTENPKREREYI